jgi:glutathione S-transferase
MFRLYYAPRTRSVRIRWLLEELGLPYELERVEFLPKETVFAQATPLGKFPVLVDGEVVIGESGAIVEYILERSGDTRLAPPIGSPLRGPFLQWIHFAEATAFAPLGVIVWHALYRGDADRCEVAIEAARERGASALAVVERQLEHGDWLLGTMFSAADVMLGFTLAAAQLLGVLDERYPKTLAYFSRLSERPAFQRAMADWSGVWMCRRSLARVATGSDPDFFERQPDRQGRRGRQLDVEQDRARAMGCLGDEPVGMPAQRHGGAVVERRGAGDRTERAPLQVARVHLDRRVASNDLEVCLSEHPQPAAMTRLVVHRAGGVRAGVAEPGLKERKSEQRRTGKERARARHRHVRAFSSAASRIVTATSTSVAT